MRIAQSCSRATDDQPRHLLLHRLVPLDVVEVAGVVAQLLHVRRDLLREAVVLLQIDGEVRVRTGGADLRERDDVLRVVDGDADHVRAGGLEQFHLADRGGDVLRARGRHRLHGDRIGAADPDVADADLAGLSGRHAPS
jgi:hypothetical protein